MKEIELYDPMCKWLEQYLKDKYKNSDIIVCDSHSQRLDIVLEKYNIKNSLAIGIDIQIDILGIVKNTKSNSTKLFFIEAKKNQLTLRDLGQLWAYCKLIDPEEAFLFSASNLGSLDKLLNVYKREDLLDFGDGKKIKKMKICKWNINTQAPDLFSIIPKI